jgi:hypothetical protein
MIDDLSDDPDTGPQKGAALITAPSVGQNELIVLEQMHRFGSRDFPGSGEVLFTMETESGDEVWDAPVAPDFLDEGVRWAKIMSWPRVPEIWEAEAFQLNARRACMASWWSRLAAPRALDDQQPAGRSAFIAAAKVEHPSRVTDGRGHQGTAWRRG